VVASRFPALPFIEPLDPANISDAPLFRWLTRTVAVNPDHHLADLAAVRYCGKDLAEAYALGRSLLAARGGSA
jgi:phosphoserine phosphatase